MNLEEWKAERKEHIGSSEAAALFGCSPWLTWYHLWHIKANNLPHPEIESEIMSAGRHLEVGLASWAAEKWGWSLIKGQHTVHPKVNGLACTPDYIDQSDNSPVEFKFSEFGEGWVFDGDEIIDAPTHYLIQLQTQIDCLGANHGWLVVYKQGKLRRMLVKRHAGLIDELHNRVHDFWASIVGRNPPAPDYKRDGNVIEEMRKPLSAEYLDLSNDNRMHELLRIIDKAKAIKKSAEEEYEECKAELSEKMGHHKAVRCGNWTINTTEIQPNEGTLILPDMVGKKINPRKGYLRLNIKKESEHV